MWESGPQQHAFCRGTTLRGTGELLLLAVSSCFPWRMSKAELLGQLDLDLSLGAVSPGSPGPCSWHTGR